MSSKRKSDALPPPLSPVKEEKKKTPSWKIWHDEAQPPKVEVKAVNYSSKELNQARGEVAINWCRYHLQADLVVKSNMKMLVVNALEVLSRMASLLNKETFKLMQALPNRHGFGTPYNDMQTVMMHIMLPVDITSISIHDLSWLISRFIALAAADDIEEYEPQPVMHRPLSPPPLRMPPPPRSYAPLPLVAIGTVPSPPPPQQYHLMPTAYLRYPPLPIGTVPYS